MEQTQAIGDFVQQLTTPDAMGATDPIQSAAAAVIADLGIRKTSMDDIATKAGVSRVTLYRKYKDRDSLILKLVLSESQRCLSAILQELAAYATMEEKFVQGFTATVLVALQHPLFAPIFVENASGRSQQVLTVSAANVLDIGRIRMIPVIENLQQAGHFRMGTAAYVAELLIRTWQSIVLVPSDVVDGSRVESVTNFARNFLFPMLNAQKEL